MSAWAPPQSHPSAEREEASLRGVEAMGVKGIGIEAIGVLKTECQDNWVSGFSNMGYESFPYMAMKERN